MSIAVVIAVPTTAEHRDELVERLGAILPDTRTFEGCESVHLVAEPGDANTVVLIEYWSSAERYDAYRAWRAESGTSVLASDLVFGSPAVTVYEVLS